MSSFHENMISHLGIYKQNKIGVPQKGEYNYKGRILFYDHILPKKDFMKTFFLNTELISGVLSMPKLIGRAAFSVLMKKEKQPEQKLSFREVDFDEELFFRLRDVRSLIAKEYKIPPNIVFSDKTLKEMSHLKPDDRAAMLRVSGVGERKMDQYGYKFLSEVRSYLGY